jgi:hypothetical protein
MKKLQKVIQFINDATAITIFFRRQFEKSLELLRLNLQKLTFCRNGIYIFLSQLSVILTFFKSFKVKNLSLHQAKGKSFFTLVSFSFLFLFSAPNEVFGQVGVPKDKIFISEPESKLNPTDFFKDKVKSQILVKLLKINNNRFTIFDTESIKAVLELKAKQQLLGCSEKECGLVLDKILQPDFKISSSISLLDKKYNLGIKLLKVTGESPSITSAIEKSFEEHQLEFYIEEMLQYLLNPNYRVRDEIAPQKIVLQYDFLPLKIKDGIQTSKSEEGSPNSSDKMNQYINDINPLLGKGDKFYSESNYWEAYKIYSSIVKTIRNDLTGNTQILLRDFLKQISEKMEISYFNSYATEIKKIDQIFLEKTNQSTRKVDDYLNPYLKYEGLYQHFQKNQSSHPGNRNEVEELILGRMDTVLIQKWSLDEKQGDDQFVSYQFSATYKIYDKILNDQSSLKRKETSIRKKYRERIELKKLTTLRTGVNYSKNKIIAYTDIMERKNSIYLMHFRSSNENDPKAIEANSLVKQFSKELEFFLLSPDQELFILNESISIHDRVAKEINDSRTSIQDPFRVLVLGGNLDAFKKMVVNERRKKEIKELEKSTTSSQTTKISTSPNSGFSGESFTYYTVHTLLFPFKYLLNIVKSVTDIITITPIAGLGGGTEILFFYIGSGVGFAPDDFTLTTVVPFEKDSVPGAPGEFIGDFGFLGFNTCENYFFIRGLGDCRVHKLQQYTTMNFYFSFGVGAHVTFDLGRVVDIIPVLLMMDAESLVYSRNYKAARIEYFP